ncbi:MAG: neutral/alkaline non-lysosomal ceramidase N-terminal domain-containing protein [Bryobacteraceae bacterium]
MFRLILLLGLTVCGFAADYRAGVARVDITPKQPIWMSGYASRNRPSDGVIAPLFAKALAIEDRQKARVVIVTTDLVGLPRAISDVVAARVQKQFGLERADLVLNSSHTHTGPIVRPNLISMFNLKEEDDRVLREYAQQLTDDLVSVVGAAIGDLAPAVVMYGEGEAGFAINRREPTAKGIKIGLNPTGPVDHKVPVFKVTAPDGTVRAVLFGYACHNTTLTGEFYKLSADYAGFAQSEVETAHPGATALFFMLCGGDQNPNPRSSLDVAKEHGKELGGAVNRVMDQKLMPLNGRIRTAFVTTELAFAPHTRETFETLQKDPVIAKRKTAEAMLRAYDDGRPVRSLQYPVQAIRFGNGVAILALGGEVVIDYDLRAQKEYPKHKLVVAGYSNEVMCYIPSKRVLAEGGYEAVDSMVYYGQPGPFTPEVEETIFHAIHRVMKRVGL